MNKFLVIIILLFTMPLNGFGVDIYVPSLPIVREYFNTSTQLVQLTIGSYLLGFALIQLIIGVVCDSIGRRKPYLYALTFYIIATIAITQIHDIYYLLLLRFIQGLTVGTFVVACRAIMADLFTGKKLQKVANYMAITWSIGPIIAPMIGGYLQHYFNWQASFCFLAIYALICIVSFYFSVPETLQTKKEFTLQHLLTSYKLVFKSLEFWLCTFVLGCVYSLLILFNVVAPFLIEEVMHYSVVTFGYIALLMGLMWFLGTISNKLLHNVTKSIKSKFSFIAMLISVIVMLSLSFRFTNIYAIIIPASIIFYCGGIMFSAYFAHNMAILPNTIAATAGAFMGASTVATGAICGSFLGSQLKSTSATPLCFGLLALIIICCIIRLFEFKLEAINQ